MPNTDNRAEGMGRLVAVLTVVALAALGARIYKVEVLDKDPLRGLVNESLDDLIARIDRGDADLRAHAIGRLSSHGKVDLARVFPPLVRALGDDSEPLRYAAAGAIGRQISGSDSLSTRFGHVDPAVAAVCREAGEALEELLDDPSARVRAAAAQSLGIAASRGRLEEPPPGLIACLEDEDRQVRIEAAGAAAMFVEGPAQFLPIALRHIPVEPFEVRNAFFNAVSLVRFNAPSLPTLIEGLSSDDAWVCMACTDAIDRMGRDASSALPALLALIRRELKSPRQGDFDAGAAVLGPAIDAVGDVTPASGPRADEAVALLREILDDANPPGSSRGTGPGGLTPEARLERRQDGAARALGKIGRAASGALPRLLALHESRPRASAAARGQLAEVLFAIARGTPEQDRVVARLVEAWKGALEPEKIGIELALRGLGPEAERILPDLKGRAPVNKSWSALRRLRYRRTIFERPFEDEAGPDEPGASTSTPSPSPLR